MINFSTLVVACLLIPLAHVLAAETLAAEALTAEAPRLPDFNEYNRSNNQGSVISGDIQFQGKPTDRLEIGAESPLKDSWRLHSTLTTGLFPVSATAKKQVAFQLRTIKSQSFLKLPTVLWISIRYYNRHGVMLGSSRGKKIAATEQWNEVFYELAPKNSDTAYAEVWFVKFQDADRSGATNHPIYLSALEIR